jgi:hypothetical protein
MTMPADSAVHALRPTLVVAEALVERQQPSEIVDRALALGFSHTLTTAVVGACCGQASCDTIPASTPGRNRPSGPSQS